MDILLPPVIRCFPSTFLCKTQPVMPTKPKSHKLHGLLSSIETTRLHLSNLEKLIQKPSSSSITEPPTKKQKRPREWLSLAGLVNPETHQNDTSLPKNMQQLLSRSPENSPRKHIGEKWEEYHGSHNWNGLLDPLDENLRREVIRYGEFVQSAYEAFYSAPNASPSCPPPSTPLTDSSYKVTRSLYATSSLRIPKWVDQVAPELKWMTQRSSSIGYVAVCQEESEIKRMGRRDIVIALRGTATCMEWAENFRDVLVPLAAEKKETCDSVEARVECGFLSLYRSEGEGVLSLSQMVVGEVRRLARIYKGERLSVTVTGHSLGAALALLVAEELRTTAPFPVAVFSFGGPRVGNRGFADRINRKNVKVLRIVNQQDMITKIPGVFTSEGMEETLKKNGVPDGIVEAIEEKLPWAYRHVGVELRVDTRMSPYLKPDADAACCHDLEAYLHLVDGFTSSQCPFRANAKRSLAKLLQEQGSNIKKLYTSKAKALNVNNCYGIRDDGNYKECIPVLSS